MRKLHAAALFAAAFGLTACVSEAGKKAREANPAPCPNIVVLNDAARFINFDGAEALENITYTGEIVDVSSTCRYFAANPINAEVSIDLAFGKGPKGAEQQQVFKYFVAVTRKDTEVIAKQEFAVPIKFDGDRPVQTERVNVDKIHIPRAGENVSGTNFEIIVGFVLTPQQALYNRSGKSLKFPNIK